MHKLVLGMLCVVPSLAFASNWQVIHRQDQDWMSYLPGQDLNGILQHSIVSISIDRDSIINEGNIKRAWWKETAEKNGRVMDLINLTSFDCHEHKLRTDKAGSRNSTSLPYEWSQVNGQVYDIEPDDPWDHVFEKVCLKK